QHRRHFSQQQVRQALSRDSAIEHRARISIQAQLAVLLSADKGAAESDLVRATNPAEVFSKLVGDAVISRANAVSAADVEAVGHGHQEETWNVVINILHSEIREIEIFRGVRFVRNRIDHSVE